MRRLVILSVALASLFLILGTVVATFPKASLRTTYFAASFPAYELPDLLAKAESIAVVRSTGTSQVHWNSKANTPWTPELGSGKVAMIYRDDAFDVVRQIAGAKLPVNLTIRGFGGTVGSDRHILEDQPEWQTGREYLVFLHQESTPTDSGSEQALIVVWIGHGAFRSAGPGHWVNDAGFTLAEADLAR